MSSKRSKPSSTSTKAPAQAKKQKQSKKTEDVFAGCTFCITGTLSVPRKDFSQLLTDNGAAIAGSVTAAVTHLIASKGEEGTAKYQQALKKGIPIVDEDWARQAVSDGILPSPILGSSSKPSSSKATKPSTTATASKTTKTTTSKTTTSKATAEHASKKSTAAKSKTTGAELNQDCFAGMTFCITGKLSMPRAELVKLIQAHKGSVATSMTAKVTHLIASSEDAGTSKYESAEEKGIPIVAESFIHGNIARPRLTPAELWAWPIWDPDPNLKPATDAMLDAAEKQLGLKQPAAYRRLLKIQNGGRLMSTAFPTYQKSSWSDTHVALESILPVGGTDGIESENNKGTIEEWGYPDVGPIVAECPSGGHDIIMLDYRTCGPKGEPSVLYVDTEPPFGDAEYATIVLAPNFEQFLCQLRPDSEFN